MSNTSITNAVKYNKVDIIKDWLENTKKPKGLNGHLVKSCANPKTSAEIVRLLLEKGANPNYTKTETYGNETYTTSPPLSLAARSGSIEKLELLLNAGADIDYNAPHGFKVMNSAVYGNSEHLEDMVKYLIFMKVDLDAESKYGESPLSVASHQAKFNIVKLLLAAGADPSRLGWDELLMAIVFGSLEECGDMIAKGADMNKPEPRWGRTPFLLAVHAGETKKAKLLLKHGAKLDALGRFGKSNLMYAVEKDNAETVKWLISQGADVNYKDEYQETSLIAAAVYGAVDCIKVLLDSGADLNAETHTKNSAIDSASNIETVKVLVEAGANINKISGEGYNLLLYATEDGNYEFVEQLLELGANPNTTSTGNIPLHKATIYDDTELMKLLLKYGSNPSQEDVDSDTPLHWAKSIEAAEILLDAGADPHIENIDSQNAIDYNENEEIREFITSKIKK